MCAWATFDSSQGGQEKKKFLGCSLCIKTMRCIATHCQYSAVKNNLKRLPAFTKLWSFDSLTLIWMAMRPVLSVSWWPFILNQKCARCFSDVHISFPCLFPMSLDTLLWWDAWGKNKQSVVGLICHKSHTIHFWTFYRPLLEMKLLVDMSLSQSLHTRELIRELDLAQDARCLWKFGQDSFQNKSERFLPRPLFITDISRMNPASFPKLCSMYVKNVYIIIA